MSEIGQEPVNAILAMFDVYCPDVTVANNPATNETNNGPGNQVAENGAEQDRIYKST